MIRNTAFAAIAAAAITMTGAATAQTQTPTPAPVSTPTPSASGVPMPKNLDEMFEMTDVNRDGRITRQELHTFGLDRNLGKFVNETNWRKADRNRNGWLSKAELEQYSERKNKR